MKCTTVQGMGVHAGDLGVPRLLAVFLANQAQGWADRPALSGDIIGGMLAGGAIAACELVGAATAAPRACMKGMHAMLAECRQWFWLKLQVMVGCTLARGVHVLQRVHIQVRRVVALSIRSMRGCMASWPVHKAWTAASCI